MEFFRIKDSIEWIQIIWSVIFVLSSIGNFVYQVVLHADTQDFRISFRTRSWLIERLSSSDCTELRSHPIKRSYVSSSELPLVKILGLSGASYACHIKHGSREQAEWYDTQQANYVPWDLSARTPAQNSSALSAVTIIRGSPALRWAIRRRKRRLKSTRTLRRWYIFSCRKKASWPMKLWFPPIAMR